MLAADGKPGTGDAYEMIQVIRRWKRDGSENHMGMNEAVINLQRNNPDKNWSRETIINTLMQGEKLETEHAVFSIW